ncbi:MULTISPECIES: hypothetical protein [Aeromonas]|uniref:hypothetical protein n=1 Tax=Aeromonas TaxID=642 RepID=UPI0032EAB926
MITAQVKTSLISKMALVIQIPRGELGAAMYLAAVSCPIANPRKDREKAFQLIHKRRNYLMNAFIRTHQGNILEEVRATTPHCAVEFGLNRNSMRPWNTIEDSCRALSNDLLAAKLAAHCTMEHRFWIENGKHRAWADICSDVAIHYGHPKGIQDEKSREKTILRKIKPYLGVAHLAEGLIESIKVHFGNRFPHIRVLMENPLWVSDAVEIANSRLASQIIDYDLAKQHPKICKWAGPKFDISAITHAQMDTIGFW